MRLDKKAYWAAVRACLLHAPYESVSSYVFTRCRTNLPKRKDLVDTPLLRFLFLVQLSRTPRCWLLGRSVFGKRHSRRWKHKDKKKGAKLRTSLYGINALLQ